MRWSSCTRRFGLRAGWLVFAIALLACDRTPAPEAVASGAGPVSVSGTLRVSAFGEGESDSALSHVHTWVDGPNYHGMEDNDLRGFLDGRFIYGWNQPRQIHNRLGRRGSRPRWGETELFRTLLRWEGVELPALARVEHAEIRIEIEKTPKRPLTVLLYEVRKDWNPGEGGVHHDNTSPPLPGEVWWGELAAGETGWGFAGAGFASETDPDADTPVTALAEARVEPRQSEIVFRSEALARLVERRARHGRPLDLLLKVSDELEDTPDTLLYIYAGNHGDRRNPARRPRLEVRWAAAQEVASLERLMLLEHGRTAVFPRVLAPGAKRLALSFEADEGREPPLLQVRGGKAGADPSAWQPGALPLAVDWDWLEVRAQAALDPVMLGHPFETGFRDTWVRTAPPDEQSVVFHFEAPSGAVHAEVAAYEGDYTWSVAFVPDELGRHRYWFEHDFLKHHYESAEGRFDVVTGDLPNIEEQLRGLLEQIRSSEGSDAEIREEAPLFWRLERAVYRQATPTWMVSEPGRALFGLLTQIRAKLSGRDVPDEAIPQPMRRDF